jgi:CRP-like cAMP-binding protein
MEIITQSTIDIIRSQRKSFNQVTKLYEKLGKIDFFRNYANKDQKAVVYDLLSKMKLEEYPANKVVFMRGEVATKFYIILEGEVAIFLDDDKGLQNKCPYPAIEKNFSADPQFFCQNTQRFLLTRVAVMKEGQSFGELGVMHGKPRLASVLTTKDSSFGVLSSEDFRTILQPSILVETDKKVRYFKSLLDRSCHFDEIWRLTAFFQKITFEKYQTLLNENEGSNRLFVIVEGLIQLEKNICFEDPDYKKQLAIKDEQILSPHLAKNSFSNRITLSSLGNDPFMYSGFNAPCTQARKSQKIFEIEKKSSTIHNELFKKVHKKTIHGQPIILYGQNQFIGFKEFLEDRNRSFFTARIVEPGYGYWIHVSNMRRCFSDFKTFETFFMERHRPMLKSLNVTLIGFSLQSIHNKKNSL